MDTYELMTSLRNIVGKHTEKDLPTAELLRCLNLANNLVSQLLYPLFKDDLVASLQPSGQSGDYFLIPDDVLLMVNVYRKNAAGSFKLANKLDIDNKSLIGNEQYPSDENYPIYVQFGDRIEFTPALSSTDIKFEYRKRIADLLFGIGNSSADETTLTLDNYAPVRNNVISGYFMALYKKISGDLRKVDVVQVMAYTASSKQALCTCPDGSQEYTYALIPILPGEFHNYLIDGGLMYLAKSGYYDKDAEKLREHLREDIGMTLQLHGIEYKLEGKGK